MTFAIDIVTLFPDLFPGPLDASITGRALHNQQWNYHTTNIRDFSSTNYKTVDDTPYGGGAGMVLKADVLYHALTHVNKRHPHNRPIILLTPRGYRLNQQISTLFAKQQGLIVVCAHYEGYDERITNIFPIIPICIGDYILTSGEIATYPFLDSVIRLLPNVIQQHSLKEESFSQPMPDDMIPLGTNHINNDQCFHPNILPYSNILLEYPQYTRPQTFLDYSVPEILLSGHHKNIQQWRKEKAWEDTKRYRMHGADHDFEEIMKDIKKTVAV